MLKSLDHVMLAVRDLDAARASYEKLLGLAPSWSGTHPEHGMASVLFRVENACLELLATRGDALPASVLRSRLADRGDGLIGLAFGADDLEECRRTMAASGLEPGPVEAVHGRDDGSGAERHWHRVAAAPHRTRGIVIFAIRHDRGVLPMATAHGEAAASVHALDHVVVQTTDANAARSLYGDALGIRLALDREFADWGVRLMFFRVGGVTVEVATALTGAEAGAAIPGVAAIDGEDRLYGLSWRVRDIDSARARIAAAGIDVSDVRTGRRRNTRVCTVRSGTCGVPTLLIELGEGER